MDVDAYVKFTRRRRPSEGAPNASGGTMGGGARWFLAGIFVSLVNTALVLAFVIVPFLDDELGDNRAANVLPPPVAPTAPASTESTRTVIVVDEFGNVLLRETTVTGDGTGRASPSAGGGFGGAIPRRLAFDAPQFEPLVRPSALAAFDGTAYITTLEFSIFELRIGGSPVRDSLTGVDDFGDSIVVDVDVTSSGAVFALVRDRALDWRLIRRLDDRSWTLVTSADLVAWPADVNSLAVADDETFYIGASDPLALVRIDPFQETVTEIVAGQRVFGIDVIDDFPFGAAGGRAAGQSSFGTQDHIVIYAAPQTGSLRPDDQIGIVRQDVAETFNTDYEACRQDTREPVPQFPRDVSFVQRGLVLIADSSNHVILLQNENGQGQVIFGVPCERGEDQRHLRSPRSVSIDAAGNVFIADTTNNRIVILPAASTSTGTSSATATPTPAAESP